MKVNTKKRSGVAETYKHFYDPNRDDRVKLELDSDGNIDCTNGKHRCESAKEKNIFVPAEVSCVDERQLADAEQKYGSGRNLSQFNPRAEQIELDQKQPPFNWDDFKSKYADNAHVDRTPDTNEFVNRYADSGSIKSTPETNEKFDNLA